MGNSPTVNPPASPTMNASALLDRLILVATQDQTNATAHGVVVTPKGRFQSAATKGRISQAEAIAMIERNAAPEPEAPKNGPRRTGFTFGSLNAATQAVFYRLCEDIQTATQDHDMQVAARLGHDVRINLVDAPRVTSLKKCGLLETVDGAKKSHRMLRLTDAGRALWFAHTGNA